YGDEVGVELALFIAHDKDALHVVGILGGIVRDGLAGLWIRVAHDKRLNGDDDGIFAFGGGDFCGRREARFQLGAGLVKRNDHFEVLGFFLSAGGLAGGEAGGAEQRLIAYLGDMAFEDLAGNGIDSYVRRLAEGDVHNIGFVNLDLGGDDRDVGESHQDGAVSTLN